jgi:hypothetical protein
MSSRNLIILGIFAVLLAGCVTIEYEQIVDRDGGSVITERIDLSALVAMSEQYGEESDLSTICVNITKGQSDVDCKYDNGIITVKKSFKASDGKYMFTKTSELPYTVYTLEVRELPDLFDSESLDESGSTSTDFKSAEAKTAAASLKTAGAELTYNVSMPGEIYLAENGEIKNGKAQFDVLELMSSGEYIVVKSRELDLMVVGGAIVVLVVVIGAVAFFVLKKK